MAQYTEGQYQTLPTDSLGRAFEGGADDQGRFWPTRVDQNQSTRVALWGTNNAALLTTINPGYVSSIGSNLLLVDNQAVFAANAAAGSSVTLDINMPAATHPHGYAYVAITNPSATTPITVIFQNMEVFNYSGTPATHYPEVRRITVGINRTEGVAVMVQGWLLGDGARMVVKNDRVADSGGFTVAIKVRKV